MENRWEKILSFDKLYLAEIVKGYLIENNIPAIILNKKDTMLLHHSGKVELFVDKKRKKEALKSLKS